MPIETIRRSYRPENINVLFVGESPPVGGRFFYIGDSLTQYTKMAFSNVYNVNFNNDDDFLKRFKRNNFYLDDLCLTPINRLNDICRNEMRKISVSILSERIIEHPPKIVISIMIAIKPFIMDALALAEIDVKSVHSLPFPAWSDNNKKQYVSMLTQLLLKLKNEGQINTTFFNAI